MIFIELFLLYLALAFLPAIITAYIAYSHGRSLWRWFLFGLALPYVSIFIAMFVAIRHKQRVAAARGGTPAPVPKPGEFE